MAKRGDWTGATLMIGVLSVTAQAAPTGLPRVGPTGVGQPSTAVLALPDIAITSLVPDHMTLKQGEWLGFSLAMRNVGHAAAPSGTLWYGLSIKHPITTPSKVGLAVSSLRPGEALSLPHPGIQDLYVSGPVTLWAEFTPSHAALEESTANNRREVLLVVEPRPNLTPADYPGQNPSQALKMSVAAFPNQVAHVTIAIRNLGGAPAPPTQVELACPGSFPFTADVPVLQPNARFDAEIGVVFTTAGTRACKVIADATRRAEEVSEADNERPVTLTFTPF